MNCTIKNLKGSPKRDLFKRKHKDIGGGFEGCDLDFVLIEKLPVPDIVAALDFKDCKNGDGVTYSETIAYNALLHRGICVYIVDGDPESGAFDISQWVGGNHIKPTTRLRPIRSVGSWSEYKEWEAQLRQNWRTRYSP